MMPLNTTKRRMEKKVEKNRREVEKGFKRLTKF